MKALRADPDPYLAPLRYVDGELERLFVTLQREGLLRNTVVLILGDHGRHERVGQGGGHQVRAQAAASSAALPARSARFGALPRCRQGGRAVATPFAPLAMTTTAPAGRLARAAVLAARRGRAHARRPRRHIDALGPRFDGRLRIFAVDRANGRRVIFGAPDAPRATVAEAVLASCAVPWIFAPVEIGGREYVDGGVWSPTNLDAVPAGRGSRVLCLIPTAGATLTPLRTASAAAVGYEAMALRRAARRSHDRPRRREPRGDRARPDGPEPRAAVVAAGYAQGRRLS